MKVSVFAFLKLVRSFNLLILAFTQYMCRYFIVGNGEESVWSILADWKFFLLVLCTVMVAAAGYIINDYYDVKIDLINKPKRVVIGKVLHRRIAIISHFILNTLACFIAIFLGLKLFLIIVATTILMWAYANYLKRTVLVGNLLISVLTGVAVYLPALLYHSSEVSLLFYACFAFFISFIREIIKDMEDVKGDEEYGCKTLPIVWGIRKTKTVIYAISVACIALISFMLVNGNSTLQLYFLLLPAPLFIWLLVKLTKADTAAHFLSLSHFCKLIMLIGVISMVFL